MINATRSIAGMVLIEYGGGPVLKICLALNEQEAIALCDKLRFVLEQPTQGIPAGENVEVMKLPEQ